MGKIFERVMWRRKRKPPVGGLGGLGGLNQRRQATDKRKGRLEPPPGTTECENKDPRSFVCSAFRFTQRQTT